MTISAERIDEILAEHQHWFWDTFLADLDSAFTADIACCETCYEDFIAMWPLAADEVESTKVSLDDFYTIGKRIQFSYTKEEYDVLASYTRCPRCNAYLKGHFWAYNLPFDPPEFFEEYTEEIALLISKSPFLVLDHPFAKEVFDTIQALAKRTTDSMVGTNYFRGRATSSVKKLDPKEFYKPPKEVVREGRYNHAGEPMLYLASDLETCTAELRNVMCFVAHINVQTPMRVLDFSDAYRSHRGDDRVLDALAYSSLISAKNDTDGWYRPEYKFSRFIADCAKAAGFQAIKYPSTRMTTDSHNVVIIDAKIDVDAIGEIKRFYLCDVKKLNEITI